MVVDKGMVSIVVPVYKAESTIKRCVDSILAQTYLNFELLLVDDGSPDNSGRICDEYALSDTRVKVFHKENGGVSSARNLGIDNAQGEYLVFVDSDDCVGQDYLLHMLQVDSSQLVIGGLCRRIEGRNDDFLENESEHIRVLEDLHRVWGYSAKRFLYWYPYAKLFRLDIIKSNQLRFDLNLFYSEDFCFVMDYMAMIDSFDLLKVHDYVIYITKEDANRAKKYKMDAKQLALHYEAHKFRFQKLESRCDVSFGIIQNHVYHRLLKNHREYLQQVESLALFNAQIDKLKAWVFKDEFLSIALNQSGIKERGFYFLLFLIPSFFYLLMMKKRSQS